VAAVVVGRKPVSGGREPVSGGTATAKLGSPDTKHWEERGRLGRIGREMSGRLSMNSAVESLAAD
jgi:hypothetical protein